MERKKETARYDFTVMVTQGWTYARLTPEERQRFFASIDNAEQTGALRGDYHARYTIMQALYHTFLMALGYKWVGWREPNTEKELPF